MSKIGLQKLVNWVTNALVDSQGEIHNVTLGELKEYTDLLAEALEGDEPDRSIKVGEVLGIDWLDHSHFEITSKNAYVKPDSAPAKIKVGDLIECQDLKKTHPEIGWGIVEKIENNFIYVYHQDNSTHIRELTCPIKIIRKKETNEKTNLSASLPCLARRGKGTVFLETRYC